MTVVVGVDGSPDSHAAMRLALQEAQFRNVPLMAVMAIPGEGVLSGSQFVLRNAPCPVLVVPAGT